jgi:hypothetical protein
MRIIFYITGILLTLVGITSLLTTVDSTIDDKFVIHSFGVCSLSGGAVILTLAIKNYSCRFLLFSAIILFSTTAFFLSCAYIYYGINNNSLIGTVILAFISAILGMVLVLIDRNRHHKPVANKPDSDSNALTEIAQSNQATTLASLLDQQPAQPPPTLRMPMKTWRLFLLMLFSCALYSVVLAYQIAKDINATGGKQLKVKTYILGLFIPLVNIYIFYQLAENIALLAKKKTIALNYDDPSALTGLLLITGGSAWFLPDFLYLVQISILAIPWLVLNNQMNRIRLTYVSDKQAIPHFNWKQRGIIIAGIPLMILILIGSKQNFMYFVGERFEKGENISGKTSAYQLHIPDKGWRKVTIGTLYPDTDLELMNNTGEWVVVRIQPNKQDLLDNIVDRRRGIIAEEWKNLNAVETRSLNSGEKLTPISLVHYTDQDGSARVTQSLFAATIITPDYVIEALGQQSKNKVSTVQQLVESLCLTKTEAKE